MIIDNTAGLQYLLNDDIYLLKQDIDNLDPALPEVVAEITEPLTGIKQAPVITDEVAIVAEAPALYFSHLGGNAKQFLILCHYTDTEQMDEKHLTALTSALQRKELTLDDIAILNISKYATATITELTEYFKPSRLLLLGSASLLSGWDKFALNQLQNLGGIKVLYTYSFGDMMGDRDKTKAFWGTNEGIITMHKLVFATNNAHKIEEVRAKIGNQFQLLSLDDIGCHTDIAETGTTFAQNASIKSHYIYKHYKLNCFGDDSGLEIDALDNQPGVYSARYAGKHGDHDANIDKVLQNMSQSFNRKARFRTVISLIWNGNEHFFEGTVEGTIRAQRSGFKGFGYDPIFQPEGYNATFAEMSLQQKNAISHRARAVEKMVEFLKHVKE